MCDFGIFSWPKFGPAYAGIPSEACAVEEKEAAAMFARWKGSYRLAPVAPGPESGANAPLSSYQEVYIGDDGMCFSGGAHSTKKGMRANTPYTHKLELRRVADGKPYIDNLGSQVIEDSPSELKIKLYQGGKIVLTKA